MFQNSILIRSTLNELDNVSQQKNDNQKYDDRDEMSATDLKSVDYETYEYVRRKCDMLEAERDDVINDTFALLDVSKREHNAEIEVVTNKVKKEAALEIARYQKESEAKLRKATEVLREQHEKMMAWNESDEDMQD